MYNAVLAAKSVLVTSLGVIAGILIAAAIEHDNLITGVIGVLFSATSSFLCFAFIVFGGKHARFRSTEN